MPVARAVGGAAGAAIGNNTGDGDAERLVTESQHLHRGGFLVERGVRVVQINHRGWDQHGTLPEHLKIQCLDTDRGCYALIADLKQRGLLKDTLVAFVTEFGRMPTHQVGTSGRDHNPDAYTTWMMGAGVKGGVSYGATDEMGRRSVTDVATCYDFYATVLHLLGLDHEKLTFRNNGVDRRLTDVHGELVPGIIRGASWEQVASNTPVARGNLICGLSWRSGNKKVGAERSLQLLDLAPFAVEVAAVGDAIEDLFPNLFRFGAEFGRQAGRIPVTPNGIRPGSTGGLGVLEVILPVRYTTLFM